MSKAFMVVMIGGIAVLVVLGLLAVRNKRRAPLGTFSIFRGEVDGRPLFAMIDEGLGDLPAKERPSFFLSLSTLLESPTSEGLPTRSDADDLNAWEDAVEARLRPGGRVVFLGRVTWNGRRELMYYVDDQQASVEALGSLSRARSTRPFALTCERDEGWQKADFWLHRQ